MDLIKIGKYIATKRKNLGLTQKQVAEKIGMSDKSVSKWERGICLPDVSVYVELCEILGISINEFLAGEDISQENMAKKSEDTIIEVTRNSTHRIRNLKSVIAVLVVIAIAAVSVSGMLLYRNIFQPRNYISAADRDSVEMKTAELLSGTDGAFLFDYSADDPFRILKIYMTEYQSGVLIKKEEIGSFGYEDTESPKKGKIALVPDAENSSVHLIVADDFGKYSVEIPTLDRAVISSYGRSSTQINGQIDLQYNSEQGLLALIYGKNGVEATPVSSIEKGEISKRNEYVYYVSLMFEK